MSTTYFKINPHRISKPPAEGFTLEYFGIASSCVSSSSTWRTTCNPSNELSSYCGWSELSAHLSAVSLGKSMRNAHSSNWGRANCFISHEINMNVGSTILRICAIQSLILDIVLPTSRMRIVTIFDLRNCGGKHWQWKCTN